MLVLLLLLLLLLFNGMGCVQVLADPDRRRGYDEGVDIKVKRGRKDEDDDSVEEVRWNNNNNFIII
jgi:hypothetical protein